MAYDRLDSIPDPWQQTGTVCSTLANLWTDKGKFTPDDFIPRVRPKPKILSGKAGLAWFQSIDAGLKAQLDRARKQQEREQPSPPSAGSRSDCPPTAPPSSQG